jgi:hypothetical protein
VSGRPNAPLLAPARAARLLEDVIFTRVAELIDLPRLYDLEAMLALQIENLAADGEPDHDDARALAKTMVDRALVRVARTSRKWTLLDRASGEPAGEDARSNHVAPARPDDDACEICGSPCEGQEQSANA